MKASSVRALCRMIDGEEILEEKILREYKALDISERNPSGFLRLAHQLYPEMTKGLVTKARGWQACRILVHALRLPSVVEKHGGEIEQIVDLSVCLESAIDIIIATQRLSKNNINNNVSVSLCRYCWRLGEVIYDRRGYKDLNRIRRLETHAYCAVHKPRSQKIATGGRGQEERIYRKVLNQKEIQNARKVSRIASRIERCVIARDKRLAHGHGMGRAWVLGDYFIIHELKEQWKQLVIGFFPYVASSSTWGTASLSPSKAFELLESDNRYEGKSMLHQKAIINPELMAQYLMPMMLRLDTWLEAKLMIYNKKIKRKRQGFKRHYIASNY